MRAVMIENSAIVAVYTGENCPGSVQSLLGLPVRYQRRHAASVEVTAEGVAVVLVAVLLGESDTSQQQASKAIAFEVCLHAHLGEAAIWALMILAGASQWGSTANGGPSGGRRGRAVHQQRRDAAPPAALPATRVLSFHASLLASPSADARVPSRYKTP